MSGKLEQSEQEEEDTSSSGLNMATPAKKAKRMRRYRKEWAAEFPWSVQAAGNEFVAICSLCRKTISIANRGRGDLIQHAKTESHVRAVRAGDVAKIDANFAKTTRTTTANVRQVRSQFSLYGLADYRYQQKLFLRVVFFVPGSELYGTVQKAESRNKSCDLAYVFGEDEV